MIRFILMTGVALAVGAGALAWYALSREPGQVLASRPPTIPHTAVAPRTKPAKPSASVAIPEVQRVAAAGPLPTPPATEPPPPLVAPPSSPVEPPGAPVLPVDLPAQPVAPPVPGIPGVPLRLPGEPRDEWSELSVVQLEAKAVELKRLALWKAMRNACPKEHQGAVNVYSEDPSLSQLCFCSNNKVFLYSRKTDRVEELTHAFQKSIGPVNCITFEKDRHSQLQWFVLWLNGREEMRFPGDVTN